MSDKSWKTAQRLYTLVLCLGFILLVVPFFYQTFRGPDIEALKPKEIFEPTPINLMAVGDRLTGEITCTLDASDSQKMIYFDFSRSGVVEINDPSSLEWDIACLRTKILTNGGVTNPAGKGGAAVLGPVDFELIESLPEGLEFKTDYIPERKGSPENEALYHWYKYDYWTHKLAPSEVAYAIRTADGRYAKLKLISYYCGPRAGCMTFRYVYQGNGSKSFVGPQTGEKIKGHS